MRRVWSAGVGADSVPKVPARPVLAAGPYSRLSAAALARGQEIRRNTATAFWPPKPKPLMIAVSTASSRATFGV